MDFTIDKQFTKETCLSERATMIHYFVVNLFVYYFHSNFDDNYFYIYFFD